MRGSLSEELVILEQEVKKINFLLEKFKELDLYVSKRIEIPIEYRQTMTILYGYSVDSMNESREYIEKRIVFINNQTNGQ